MIWMSQDGAPRKNDTDGENDREPDQPHGHPQALPRVGRAEGAVGYPRFAYSKSVSSCRVASGWIGAAVYGRTSRIRNVCGSKTNQSTPTQDSALPIKSRPLQSCRVSVAIDDELVKRPGMALFPDSSREIATDGRGAYPFG
jgi:hypothetical protein